MSGVIGVELTTDRARAVVLRRWRSTPAASVDTAWDPARPDDLVQTLRQQFGPVSSIALSVGLGFLHVKQVTLPPVPIAERRRMLTLEPDRFFPVQGESIVVALAGDRDLAFAMNADVLDRWVTAFERWAPVDLVEPAPVSLARSLGRGAEGTFALPAPRGERALVELRSGVVRGVRRIPATDALPEAPPVPARAGIGGDLLFAAGAARGTKGSLESALLADPHAARISRRRMLRTFVAGATAAAALVLALWSLDNSRERALERVRAEIGVLEARADRAAALRDRLAALDTEAATISMITERRSDPLVVLQALSESLPGDATVLGLRVSGDTWQINGRAVDAAAILPALDADARFNDVRFLSASSRFREGDRMWETFAIEFRVRPPA